MASRWRSCSTEGITRKSDMEDLEIWRSGNVEMFRFPHSKFPDFQISGYHSDSAIHGRRSQRPAACAGARLSADRAVLAVRRSAGAADRRGAGGAQPRVERGAVRHAEAAVLDHARVPL